jgi:hypothetical protein
MKFFDPRGDIEKTAHKLPHWQQGEVAIFVTSRLAKAESNSGVLKDTRVLNDFRIRTRFLSSLSLSRSPRF